MPRKKFSRRQLSWAALGCSIVLFVAVVFSLRHLSSVGAEAGSVIGLDGKIVTLTATALLAIVATCMVVRSFGDLFSEVYKVLSRFFLEPGNHDQGLIVDSGESREKRRSTKKTYIAKRGDTLSSIARERYGSHEYAKVLALYEGFGSQERLRVGQAIRTPYPRTILANEGLTKTHEAEVDLMLKALAAYKVIENQLANLPGAGNEEGLAIPPTMRKKLDEVANLIDKARIGFSSARSPEKTPTMLVEELRRLARDLRKSPIALSDGASGYHIEAFHKRFVLAMLHLIQWARNRYE